MTGAISRRSGYHHGDLRNSLERAALELVGERGANGFTMAEASRRAGVSVAAPFKHFASREALLASLALKGYEEQERRFAAAIAISADPVQQLAEFASAYVQFTVDEAALFEITFSSGIDKANHPELEVAGAKVLDLLTAPAQALRKDGASSLALVHAIGAVAHGYGEFLRQGVFGSGTNAIRLAKENARASARKLAT